MKLVSGIMIVLLVLGNFVFVPCVIAQMSSSNFQIQWDSLTAGGDDTSSSGSYQLRDSISPVSDSGATSSSYTVEVGYRAGLYDRVADFQVHVQNRATQVAATSLADTTITVSTSAGFVSGDWVALVQDEGANQVSAIGEIVSITGSDIAVDFWSHNGILPSIDGTNDYLYNMNATGVSFGSFSSSVVSTGIVGWEVSADVADGYNVYVYEDGDLTTGTSTIPDVSDGTVSVGSREYGARSSDTTLASSTFDTQDTAITTDMQQIGSRAGNTLKSRDFLTLKASVDGSEDPGTYSQTLYILYVGDY